MCGVFGFINCNFNCNIDLNREILNKMSDVLEHRGPDSFAFWTNLDGSVNLGHRRLAIIDLSEQGKQPMQSFSNRYVMIFNGEIYNYKDIKREILEEHNIKFKGHSDTEVILAAIEIWGIKKTLEKMVGMFAIVLYDQKDKLIHLIRDRLGEKPLYYGWCKNQFIFASELKAFKQHPDFNGEVDNNVLGLYLKYNYIPAPYSIYKNIFKVNPGNIITLNIQSKEINDEKYWKAEKTNHFIYDNEKNVINELERLIKTSVERQMISSDVPIGAFLSGGVDSSTITAIMQGLSSKPVNTFSIGFHENGYDEAKYAQKVAQYLNTNHTELYLTSKESINIIPELPKNYDEPFADSSQIPTYLVSKLAKQHVTVSLSGDGGDELFGGYERYKVLNNLSTKLQKTPQFIKHCTVSTIKKLEQSKFASPLMRKFPKRSDQLFRVADMLKTTEEPMLYDLFVSSYKDPSLIMKYHAENPKYEKFNLYNQFYQENGYLEWMMYSDLHMYLPDDILVKIDRAGMANSLESRVPLLDHNIVEFALNLPLHFKIRDNTQKWILKQVMYRYLPKDLMDRPKKGFGIPLDAWLRGPLKEWSEELLSERKLAEQGYFNPKLVQEKWSQHKNGERNWQTQLWSILMFQAWLEQQ
ncbi:asparagine synthase (glutamine-hydrolyzing) [Lysinibacillus irui]|uniref:asparagine synthase (glutamine-hydrolyzing) n=1 Tax=Lysinibacillus irui TaxID=2998077 RepID=UPI003887DBC3